VGKSRVNRIFFLLGFILLFGGYLKALDFLPPAKVFKPLSADLTYPAFAARYTLPVGAKNLAEINIGTQFGIVRFDLGESFLQFGIMGGVAARFDISQITNDLQVADYTVAFPLDYARGRWVLRLVYWHTSSHIGDDYIKSAGILPAALEKNVTDDLRLISSFDLFDWFRVYQGYSYSFNTIPDTDKPSGFYYGFEITPYLSSTGMIRKKLFLASHISALQRLGWQPSLNAKVGVKFEGEESAVSLFIQFFAGHLTYLGFAGQKETSWSAGFEFEL
jgi:hypothetical protein